MGPTAALMFLTVLLLSQQLSPCESLRVAAFNIQKLGVRRLTIIANPLTTFICLQNWDIAFLQELTSQQVLRGFVSKLNGNRICKSKGIAYLWRSSGGLPVEARNNKEIYAYIFRNSKINSFSAVVHQETYTVGKTPQTQAPVFFRPPYVADVHVRTNNVPELHCMPHFVLIGIHTRPTRTHCELNGLVDVYDWAKQTYRQENTLILGDLNADGAYFGPVDKLQNVLRKRRDFKWLVTDGMKTNVAGSRAYDRIIAAGSMMARVANSGNVLIPKWRNTVALSDHYPVSVDLKCRTRRSSGNLPPAKRPRWW